MDDQPGLININSASVEELTTVPGIGRAMAERIIAARPFGALEDLRRVSGIGPAALERLRLLVSFSEPEALPAPAQAEEPAAPMVAETALPAEPAAPADEPVPALEEPAPMDPRPVVDEPAALEALAVAEQPASAPAPAEESPAPTLQTPTPVVASAPQAAPAYLTRMQAFWMSLTTGIITFLLALAFVLGFLTLINGGLRYTSPQQLSSLGREVEGITSGLEIVQQDMDGVRSRLSNLEGLSGRVSEVEKSTATLRRDLESASGRIDQLQEQAKALGAQVEEMQARTNRFQGFLDGLRELINGVFKP